MIPYNTPADWFRYDLAAVAQPLLDAKAAVDALRMLPYQRDWVERLQGIQLKREVAGTSRIEGADFTEGELDQAMKEPPGALLTRSQRQASAAVRAYRWIAEIPEGAPIDVDLIRTIHRFIVEGADDDHCVPGLLRGPDQNVTFGAPPHRGAEGGAACEDAFRKFVASMNSDAQGHDPLIRAIGAHDHLAAIHPFLDGNGRTARALEALLLGRAGLKDVCFISMSNYYYDEKPTYLATLREARARGHDLTPFLVFALKGVRLQTQRLLLEIRTSVSKALFRDVMYELFGRMKSPKKRVFMERQIAILKLLLEEEWVAFTDLMRRTEHLYRPLKSPTKAFVRDLSYLKELRTIKVEPTEDRSYRLSANLDWPTQITETEFLKRLRALPKSKSYRFLT